MSSAPAKTTTPSAPGSGDVQIKPAATAPSIRAPDPEELFLSPRVMDAGAFSRYADALKSIIAQATQQGRTLEDFSVDAEELIRRASDSEKVWPPSMPSTSGVFTPSGQSSCTFRPSSPWVMARLSAKLTAAALVAE